MAGSSVPYSQALLDNPSIILPIIKMGRAMHVLPVGGEEMKMTASQATLDNISPAPASAIRPGADAPIASAKTWVAVSAATLGAFMAVLNIQIVNASLADIQ